MAAGKTRPGTVSAVSGSLAYLLHIGFRYPQREKKPMVVLRKQSLKFVVPSAHGPVVHSRSPQKGDPFVSGQALGPAWQSVLLQQGHDQPLLASQGMNLPIQIHKALFQNRSKAVFMGRFEKSGNGVQG